MGLECSAPDLSARGSKIGATVSAGATAEETASGFLWAVVDTDRSGVSRYLAGDHLDSSWVGGAGGDAWLKARIATQSDPSAWRRATTECTQPEKCYGGAVMSTCLLTSTSGGRLSVRLRGANPTGWTVIAALGG